MASNRHGKVTRIAYKYTLTGSMIGDAGEPDGVTMTRYYRNLVTAETAELDAMASEQVRILDIRQIYVKSIERCIIGMDFDKFALYAEDLMCEPVELDRS